LDLHNVLYQACKNKIGTKGIIPADCNEVRDATVAVEMNQEPGVNFNPDADYCPEGTFRASPDLFYEDFESGTDGWGFEALVGAVAWDLSGENVLSGKNSLWANDSYEKTISEAAIKGVHLPPGSKPFLHFSHLFSFDTSGKTYYDGGILAYSADANGWKDAEPLFSAGLNYGGTIAYGTNALNGDPAFVGDSHGFVDSRYDLTSLAGKMVRFRWSLGTDAYDSVLGWYIDDIRVYLCVAIPSMPSLISPANNVTLISPRPVFDWSNSTPDLHHYQLQVASDLSFASNPLTYNKIRTSKYALAKDLLPGTYYWRVRAYNAAGKASAWSTVWKFTIQ
ncbi:MAG: hypothetical protein HY867_12245, partial [Chloroflexi bacterium]|nr:hypothetical protein [Chloroflexota bacterium]